MNDQNRLTQHPQRLALHNEVHARPPQALSAPLAISHVVMVCDGAQREQSRAHLAALLRNLHLPLPDAQQSYFRMDLGQFQLRWELHTEFVSWTFLSPLSCERLGEADVGEVDAIVRRATAEHDEKLARTEERRVADLAAAEGQRRAEREAFEAQLTKLRGDLQTAQAGLQRARERWNADRVALQKARDAITSLIAASEPHED